VDEEVLRKRGGRECEIREFGGKYSLKEKNIQAKI